MRRAPVALAVVALAAAALAVAPAGRAAGTVLSVGDAYDGGAVNLAVGDELRVRLAPAGGAGATWAVAFQDSSVVKLLPAEPAAPAEDGLQTLRFQAVALGSASLGLACRRSGDPAAPPERLFRVQVSVKERVSRRALLLEEPDNGSGLYLTQGDTISVKLPANPTTGYTWSIAVNAPSILAPAGDARFEPPPTPRPGAGGFQTFDFRVAGGGAAELQLVYRRPFEKDAPPTRIWTVFIAAAAQK